MTSLNMNMKRTQLKILIKLSGVLLLNAVLPLVAQAQESIYQRFSPIDITGNWVAVITEDWHVRMITPAPGYLAGLPLSNRGRESANAFDIEQFRESGQACQAYGAPVLLREPGRLQISWQDGDTLRIDMDSGEQSRFLHFDNPPQPGAPSLQGLSLAEWQYAGGFDPQRQLLNPDQGTGRRTLNQRTPAQQMVGGKLYVETGNLSAGLLRKNGVPYSSETEVKEYFNTLTEADGTEWLIVTTIVRDPVNLLVEYITSSNFRREADNAGWDPRPCTL